MHSGGRRAAAVSALILVSVLLCAPGCGGRKDVRPEPAPAVLPQGPKVAVAPMENKTNDLAASDIIRDAFVEGVARKGFAVMPVAESDRILRETLGISYGGQLPSTTPEEVCKALGAEAVFYGDVQEWGKTTTGIYNSVAVAASFRMHRNDGVLLWEGSDRQVQRDMPRGGGNLGAEIVVRGLGNLLLNPMTPYGKRVGGNIARKLPTGVLDNTSR
ncbi:MAG TPA: GNA1162 family protein [Candidatus Methylomirabilis sp.]|nr:GNA1162 family protein [Candidatus Methylomirabilis sp.]